MLRCMQSTTDQNLNGNVMDMSVLEIQRAMFQRLCQQPPQPMLNNNLDQLNNIINQNPMLTGDKLEVGQCYNENNFPNLAPYRGENFGFAASSSDIVNNSFTNISNSSQDHRGAIMPNKEKRTCTRKRKAEVVIEDGREDKKIEAAEAKESQSEITVKSEGDNSNENSKASEVKKPDYIHVRARRGQATDSHSLAERARREKISKKMKYLQELVPGCNKVTGKAGMLDEIINYVQSLQKQVEFLSMKLAALNPRLDYNVDNLFAKELPAYIASFPTATMPLDMVNSTCFQLNPLQQGLTSCNVDIVSNGDQVMPPKRESSSMSIPEFPQFQQLSTWETNYQSPYSNVNFR